MIVDTIYHTYITTNSTVNLRPGTILINKRVVDGSDVGIGSTWAIKSIKNDKYVVHPVNGKSPFKIDYTAKQLLYKFYEA